MKSKFSFIISLLSTLVAFSQAPKQISYQAVVRNSTNTLLTNAKVGLLISLTNATDSVFFSEVQTPYTNANGLISIAIGNGTPLVSNLALIDWRRGGYYIKTQIDPTGGNNYTITGRSQITSVPYALSAANGAPMGVNLGDMLFWNGTQWAKLPVGNNGTSLTMCNGVPQWGACTNNTPTIPSVKSIGVTPSYNRIPPFLNGQLLYNGGSPVIQEGFCWSTSPNPTLAKGLSDTLASVVNGNNTMFSYLFPYLPLNQTYYCRAYAINSVGIGYGEVFTIFQNGTGGLVNPTLPIVVGDSVTMPYLPQASGNGGPAPGLIYGHVVSDGGAPIVSMGYCWSKTSSPTIASDSSNLIKGQFTATYSGADTGKFNQTFYSPNDYYNYLDTFYFRVYATNSVGTTYGNTLMVISHASGWSQPFVRSDSISTIVAGKPIYAYGDEYFDGLIGTSSRGFCWSTTPNPTITNSFSVSTVPLTDTGKFYSIIPIDSLKANTTYYFRAYAIGRIFPGTGYGNQIMITTPSTLNTSTYSIGESYGGGTIFYIDATGQHGLIVANSDAVGMIPWNQSVNSTYPTTGATNTAIGTGAINTSTIISIIGSGTYAANVAHQTYNGYSDWYLPSKDELTLISTNLTQVQLGNMQKNVYWSSSEINTNEAWAQNFAYISSSTNPFVYTKSNSAFVRAIRKF